MSETAEPAQPQPRGPGRNLPAAIGVGAGLAAVVVACLLWWNWGFVLLVAAMLSRGAVEVARAVRRLGMRPATVPIVFGTVLIVVGSYAAAQTEHLLGLTPNAVTIGSLGLTVLAALVWRMPGGSDGYVRDSAASLFLIGYLPTLGSFLSLLMAPADGAARVATFILCIVMSDTGGYVVGVLVGKHPMAPRISPKKTWEGFAGSIVAAAAMGAFLAVFALHTEFWKGILIGIALVFAGTGGDLIESMIKRDVGIKDMSHVLPGHGGVMDRLDSLLVGAPIAWIVMYLLVPGG
ncbi:phosphatidate cytidylyltransferase [Propionicicella superfundia]|uniref:phosphatidate cytidylyltransferase n=1 Tax=Propionicicella superfundia TaxID=348582 RepID=UPI0003FB1640|nr:phosphatidate cytidylyltransferase [Propionicicella superfundia]